MSREELAADLNYARALAEEGRHAPLIGGAYLVLFGALLAITYSAHWAIFIGVWPILPQQMLGIIWFGFGIAAGLGCALLNFRVRQLPGGAAVSNRVDRQVWQGVAISILVVVAGTMLRSTLQGDASAPNAIMASGFGLYGCALYVTAALSSESWLRAFAFLAWLASGLMWFFIDPPTIYLLGAGAAVMVLLVPGLIQMRREPKALV